MTKRTRRNHSPVFKAQVALAAVKGEKTLAELAQHLTFTRTRSRVGDRSFWKELPVFSDMKAALSRRER